MKKLAVIIILIAYSAVAMAQAQAHSPNDPNFSMKCKTGQYIKYTITSNKEPYTVIVNGISGDTEKMKKFEIPTTVHYRNTDFTITAINKTAFAGISSLTSITIPKTIKEIGDEAFIGCSALKNIKIGGIIEKCGDKAFSGTAIAKPIYTGNTLVYYPNNPNGYTINEGTENILEYAFSECTDLTSIIIPKSVKNISVKSFANCDKLENISVAEGNATYDSRNKCNAIIITAENKIIKGSKNSIIPNGIKTIAKNAFANTGISTIEIPNSVITIEDSAFYGCELSTITIPESIKEIGTSAFIKNKKLTAVNFNAINCKSMDKHISAFEQCQSLTSVNFGDNVKVVPAYSFKGCSELKYVTLSNSIEKIEREAFAECTNLTYIEIPLSVQKVEGNVLQNTGIYEPVFNENIFVYYAGDESKEYKIPDGIKIIAENAFYENKTLKSIIIPNSVITIDDYAFYEALALETISIPNSVTRIGQNAFKYCTKLKSVLLPNSITTIEKETFFGCNELKTIVIPNSVERLENNIFYWCETIESVTLPKSIKSIDKYAFNGNKMKYIYIPKGTMSQFKSMVDPEYYSKLKEK